MIGDHYRRDIVNYTSGITYANGIPGWGEFTMTFPMPPFTAASERSPDRNLGLTGDKRVCWALEEVGEAFEVRLVSFAATKEASHRELDPFRRITVYKDSAVRNTGWISAPAAPSADIVS